jgi:hypothetical protein
LPMTMVPNQLLRMRPPSWVASRLNRGITWSRAVLSIAARCLGFFAGSATARTCA